MGHSINYTIILLLLLFCGPSILQALMFILVLLICNYLFHTNLCKFEDIQQYCQDSYCEVMSIFQETRRKRKRNTPTDTQTIKQIITDQEN